jgi:hypothetical protein
LIRALSPTDISELRAIHDMHFRDEFDFPNFLRFITAFVVEDDDTGEIITAGGIRTIAECVLVTDLSRDPRVRAKALRQMLEASKFVCNRMGFDQIYVWSQNSRYSKRLMRTGFRLPQGQSLILDL